MKTLLGAAALAALAALSGTAHATLDCTVRVDGLAIGSCTTSNTGSISFAGAYAPLFSSISLTGDGNPVLPQPDLSSVTLDVSSDTTFTGTHTLDVDLFQTAVAAPAGTVLETTATINNLIGLPGPTTLADFINGTATTLGTMLRGNTFPVGATGEIGPFFYTLAAPLTADAHQFEITFTAPGQSANDTIQVQGVAAVREPSSLAVFGLALASLWVVGRRRQLYG